MHIVVTDVIIFGPILALFALGFDIWQHPAATPLGWAQLLLNILLFTVVGCKLRTLGISLGFHRGGTHSSYQSSVWLKGIFYGLGCASAQGRMVNWLSDHYHHHLHSDEEEDLHSPRHGFWHSYIGWLRGLLFNRSVYPRFAKDKMIMWFSRTFFIWLIAGLCLPALIGWATGFGAYRGFLCGGALGMLLANNVTYWVNSGCHLYGKQNFNTGDDSRNFWLEGFFGHALSWCLAYLSWGETNHNNHHGIAKSANHGMFKGEFDPSARFLKVLEWMGLVWQVQWTTQDQARERQRQLHMTPQERKDEVLAAHKDLIPESGKIDVATM